MRGALWLLAFWAGQVLLTWVLKAGTLYEGWYWPGLVASVPMTLGTTWLYMRVFAHFPPHLAQALGFGIAFLLAQVALAAMVHAWLTPGQVAGVVGIFTGIVLLTEKQRPEAA